MLVQPRAPGAPTPQQDRPPLRVAICGEVNAGKSTVLNALLRRRLLPDNIGESARPLIIARHRDRPGAEIRHRDGRVETLEAEVDPLTLRSAAAIELWSDAPQIAGFEFIELPMTTADAVTEDDMALMRSVDVMIWVTIASQAWRLTEKSIIGRLNKALPARSVIVVSRADKLRSDRDLRKLEERVRRETAGLFDGFAFLNGAAGTLAASAHSGQDWALSGAPAILDLLHGFVPAGPMDAPSLQDAASEGAAEGMEPENLIDLDSFRRLAPVQSRVAQAGPSTPAPPPASASPAASPAASPDAQMAEAPDAPPSGPATVAPPVPAATAKPPVRATESAPATAPATAPPSAVGGTHKPDIDPALIDALREIAGRLPEGAVAGLMLPGEGQCEVLGGDPSRCREVGRALGTALDRLGTAYAARGFDACPEAVIVGSAGARIACEVLPGRGAVFMMAPADRLSAGIARALMVQMRSAADGTGG
ncbi:dynamin family protein [Acidimangrovimonas sediminis]|uniref:dynamin family protein n=1 Tax=Acidimangrovimonas sediminis TaxID=2056283 RepID=UPI000C8002AA|nr:dynamin family protein [Acidimangrovimonas sediminis]